VVAPRHIVGVNRRGERIGFAVRDGTRKAHGVAVRTRSERDRAARFDRSGRHRSGSSHTRSRSARSRLRALRTRLATALHFHDGESRISRKEFGERVHAATTLAVGSHAPRGNGSVARLVRRLEQRRELDALPAVGGLRGQTESGKVRTDGSDEGELSGRDVEGVTHSVFIVLEKRLYFNRGGDSASDNTCCNPLWGGKLRDLRKSADFTRQGAHRCGSPQCGAHRAPSGIP